jgi:hypothetical protein
MTAGRRKTGGRDLVSGNPTEFKPGNPGRPKGSRNKLGEHFFQALHDDFVEHGVKAIEAVRVEDPGTYVKVVASLMPKEFKVERPAEELSDSDLAALIAAVGAALAASGNEADAGGRASPPSGGNSLN